MFKKLAKLIKEFNKFKSEQEIMSGWKIASKEEIDKIILNNYQKHLKFLNNELKKHKDIISNIEIIKSSIKRMEELIGKITKELEKIRGNNE